MSSALERRLTHMKAVDVGLNGYPVLLLLKSLSEVLFTVNMYFCLWRAHAQSRRRERKWKISLSLYAAKPVPRGESVEPEFHIWPWAIIIFASPLWWIFFGSLLRSWTLFNGIFQPCFARRKPLTNPFKEGSVDFMAPWALSPSFNKVQSKALSICQWAKGTVDAAVFNPRDAATVHCTLGCPLIAGPPRSALTWGHLSYCGPTDWPLCRCRRSFEICLTTETDERGWKAMEKDDVSGFRCFWSLPHVCISALPPPSIGDPASTRIWF